MIAALPMYDRPEVAAGNDRLWSLIRDRLRAAGHAAPDRLTRSDDLWPVWESPALVLAQTCGLPYRARLHERVTLVGTPDYGVEGCAPGWYRSVLVVRADDERGAFAAFDGAALAFNDDLSQSGWAAPLAEASDCGIALRPALRTGSHRGSARAVALGRAEIAAIDAVTWRLILHFDPFAASLRVIGATEPTPGLPLIAQAGADARTTADAVAGAIAALDAADSLPSGLCGLVRIPTEAYLALPLPPPAPPVPRA